MTILGYTPGQVAKAISVLTVGVLTVLAVVLQVLPDGITPAEWGLIATSVAGTLTGTGAVYQVPNTEPVTPPEEPEPGV